MDAARRNYGGRVGGGIESGLHMQGRDLSAFGVPDPTNGGQYLRDGQKGVGFVDEGRGVFGRDDFEG